jgi:ribosomal protein L37AE/L43A
MTEAEARRCAAPGCKGPDGEARHVEGTWRVCRSCSGTGFAALAGLPHRYVNLRMSLRPGSATGERVSGAGFGTRPPVKQAALNTMGDIASFLREAEREVRGLLRMRPQITTGVRESVMMIRAVTTLSTSWELAMPLAPAPWIIGTAIRRSRQANHVLGWDRLVHRLPAPCPYCDTLTLIRRDGDSLVRCTICHRSWIEAEYRHFVRMLVEEVT